MTRRVLLLLITFLATTLGLAGTTSALTQVAKASVQRLDAATTATWVVYDDNVQHVQTTEASPTDPAANADRAQAQVSRSGGPRVVSVLAAEDTVSIYKASQPGLTAQHLAEGYKPGDFPGSAFFTRDQAVAEHWGEIYGEGHIETTIPKGVFDEHLAEHEYPYPGWPGMTELEVPSGLLDLISSFPRILH